MAPALSDAKKSSSSRETVSMTTAAAGRRSPIVAAAAMPLPGMWMSSGHTWAAGASRLDGGVGVVSLGNDREFGAVEGIAAPARVGAWSSAMTTLGRLTRATTSQWCRAPARRARRQRFEGLRALAHADEPEATAPAPWRAAGIEAQPSSATVISGRPRARARRRRCAPPWRAAFVIASRAIRAALRAPAPALRHRAGDVGAHGDELVGDVVGARASATSSGSSAGR